jgi:cytochrome c-type biogenesis protein CcmH/NrfG
MANPKIEPLKRILERDPRDEVAWFGLGKAYLKDKNYPEAIQALEQALFVQPAYSAAYWALAQALYKSQELHRCRQICLEGISVSQRQGDLMVTKQLEYFLRMLPD